MINARLFDHQRLGVTWLQDAESALLAWDTGTGKTLACLSYFDYLKEKKKVDKMLVVCPLSLITSAWEDDIKQFTNFTWCNLRERNENADIYLINYESYKKVSPDEKRGALLVLDESSKIKNPKSQITKKILKDSFDFRYKVCASATPAPNSELEYWPQCHLLHPGLLPTNFYAFRNKYFVLTRGKQFVEGRMGSSVVSDMMRKGFKYKLHPKYADEFKLKLERLVMTVDKNDCLDLPEMTDVTRLVTLSPEEHKVYKQMSKECITEINDVDIPALNALSKVMKLRQSTSGFMYDMDHNVQKIKKVPTKINELREVVEENVGKQMIIFSSFKYEIEECVDMLSAIAPTVSAYSGSESTPDNVKKFKSGEARFIVAHPKTIGHGITLTNCNLMVFMSLDYSYEMWVQARGRTHRAGQKNPCTNIIILARNTIDEIILSAVKNKGDKQDLLNAFKKSMC
jgi:SNF2 family DNA or RNA helicase